MVNIYENVNSLKDIKNNNVNVIYGASTMGRILSYLKLVKKIDYFIDQNASNIKKIANVKVYTFDEFIKLNIKRDINIVFTVISKNARYTIIKEIDRIFSTSSVNVNIFLLSNEFAEKHALNLSINEFCLNQREFVKQIQIGYKNIKGYQKNGLDYIKNVYSIAGHKAHISNNNLRLVDYSSKYVNSENGFRVTNNNEKYCKKSTYERDVYIFGDSRVYGTCNEDKYTIPSILQYFMDKNNCSYRVNNCGIGSIFSYGFSAIKYMINSIDIQKDDIVYVLFSSFLLPKQDDKEYLIYYLEDLQLLANKKGFKIFFIDLPIRLDIRRVTKYDSFFFELFYHFAFYNHQLSHKKIKKDRKNLFKYKKELSHISTLKGILYFDLGRIAYKKSKKQRFFADHIHFHSKGNKFIAKELFNIFCKYEKFEKNRFYYERSYQKTDIEFKNFLLKEYNKNEWINYIEELKEKYPFNLNVIGSIVVNCNPFTNGHRYLVEMALKEVDKLFVFVVQENRSAFSFEDRFNLVKRNLEDLKNVEVLPSGKFIISTITFPEYFSKENSKKIVDVSNDVTLFASEIAKVLNIKKRFVGEEPNCNITNQYNRTMEEILPKYDIKFIEIPRKNIDGLIISASKVRECLQNKDYELLKKLVPKITYDFLIE